MAEFTTKPIEVPDEEPIPMTADEPGEAPQQEGGPTGIAEVGARVAALEARITALDARIAALEEAVRPLGAALERVEASLQALHAQLTTPPSGTLRGTEPSATAAPAPPASGVPATDANARRARQRAAFLSLFGRH